MRRRRHALPHINTSSMTDLAFTLLFFFLVAATIDTDSGILRLLPPSETAVQQADPPRIKERNVLIVELLPDNVLRVAGQSVSHEQLTTMCVQFIENKNQNQSLAEKMPQTIVPIGNCMVSKAIIYVKIDRRARYRSYIELQNTLTAAYTQMRENAAMFYFNRRLKTLTKPQLDAIKKLIPQRITETEL